VAQESTLEDLIILIQELTMGKIVEEIFHKTEIAAPQEPIEEQVVAEVVSPQEFKEKFSKSGGDLIDIALHNFLEEETLATRTHEDPAIEPTNQPRKMVPNFLSGKLHMKPCYCTLQK
jgi:hypothetical protein